MAERINKILFYKNKQNEKRLMKLQRMVHTNVANNSITGTENISSTPSKSYAGTTTIPMDEQCEEGTMISENEKLLLSQIEQQKQRIDEMQQLLNSKLKTSPDSDEHIIYMQKRIEELSADSRRYFEKYRVAREEHMKLLGTLNNEKKYGIKKSREAMAALNTVQKKYQVADNQEKETYEKRLLEVIDKTWTLSRLRGRRKSLQVKRLSMRRRWWSCKELLRRRECRRNR